MFYLFFVFLVEFYFPLLVFSFFFYDFFLNLWNIFALTRFLVTPLLVTALLCLVTPIDEHRTTNDKDNCFLMLCFLFQSLLYNTVDGPRYVFPDYNISWENIILKRPSLICLRVCLFGGKLGNISAQPQLIIHASLSYMSLMYGAVQKSYQKLSQVKVSPAYPIYPGRANF